MALDFTNSKYEDLDKVSYVSGVDLNLTTKFEPFYQRQMELFNLAVGHIFSENDLKKLKRENRPRFPMNLFMPTINALSGNFKDNVPEMEFVPGTPDDEPMIKIVEDVNHYLLNNANDANYEVGKAFVNAAIAKISWLKQTPSFAKDPMGINEIQAYSPFRIKFDLENFRRDLKYTKYIEDSGWYTPEEAIQIFALNDPEMEEEIRNKCIDVFGESAFTKNRRKLMTWLERVFNSAMDSANVGEKGYDANSLKHDRFGDFIDIDNQRLKIIDFHERRMVREMNLRDLQSGQLIPITDEVRKSKTSNEIGQGSNGTWYDNSKVQLIKRLYPQGKIEEAIEEKIYQTSVIPGLFMKTFEGEQDVQSKQFNFVPVVSIDHHPDPMELSSVVEQIEAPVKSYNVRENTILSYIMKQTHASWIIDETTNKTHGKNFRSNNIGDVIVKPEGTVEGVNYERVQPPANIPGLEKFAENNKEDWKIIGSSGDSGHGRQEASGESGKLATIRIQQTDLMNEHISSNAQNAYLMLTKNNIAYMKKYMTEPRMLRIVKEEGDQNWLEINQPILGQIVNDMSSLNVDVQVKLSPFGKQAKEAQEQKSFNMANFVASTFGPQYVPLEEVVENSTISNKTAWTDHIQQTKEAEQQAMEEQRAMEEEALAMEKETIEMENKEKALDMQLKANQAINDEITKSAMGI